MTSTKTCFKSRVTWVQFPVGKIFLAWLLAPFCLLNEALLPVFLALIPDFWASAGVGATSAAALQLYRLSIVDAFLGQIS